MRFISRSITDHSRSTKIVQPLPSFTARFLSSIFTDPGETLRWVRSRNREKYFSSGYGVVNWSVCCTGKRIRSVARRIEWSRVVSTSASCRDRPTSWISRLTWLSRWSTSSTTWWRWEASTAATDFSTRRSTKRSACVKLFERQCRTWLPKAS